MPAKGEKKKVKRKRGKKFKYNPLSTEEPSTQSKPSKPKENPFEAFATKKFAKTKTSQYSQLRNEYKQYYSNNSSTIVDKRIGEHSRNLSEEDKQKLRYRAHQLLKHKKKQDKFNILTDPSNKDNKTGLLGFTHKGKAINEHNANDSDQDDHEDDYQLDIAQELLQGNSTDRQNLTKKELLQQLIEKSKQEREEKKKERQETKDKIKQLDDNFLEINSLLKKRKRGFEMKNDDYYINMSKYQYADKTTPTERIKTEEEIEKDKQRKLERLEKMRDQEEEDSEEGSEEGSDEESEQKERVLSKKERIEKRIEERLKKAEIIMKKREERKGVVNGANNNIESVKKGEEDDMGDLEFEEEEDENEGEEEEDEEDEEDEEEDDNEEGEDDEEEEQGEGDSERNEELEGEDKGEDDEEEIEDEEDEGNEEEDEELEESEEEESPKKSKSNTKPSKPSVTSTSNTSKRANPKYLPKKIK